MSWTDSQIAELRKLWSEPHTAAQIGQLLGVSKNAVIGKAYRLGLPPKRGDRQRGPALVAVSPQVSSPRSCAWPIGDPTTPDFHFCGGSVLPGKPYCASHCAVAYTHYRKAEDADAAIAKEAVA
ncbi:MAG TPA: GcrA family cell cycle regulator [Alphaproteobacteria bacterium]|nr:GcrA family cell cycle regulator [Alphaproteobacteria bacterium]